MCMDNTVNLRIAIQSMDYIYMPINENDNVIQVFEQSVYAIMRIHIYSRYYYEEKLVLFRTQYGTSFECFPYSTIVHSKITTLGRIFFLFWLYKPCDSSTMCVRTHMDLCMRGI